MAICIIPAAGSGTRMRLDANTPAKQFFPFGNGSVLSTTIDNVWKSGLFSGLIVVVPEDDIEQVNEGLRQLPFFEHVQVIAGGEERQDSVRNGLLALPEATEYVVIHDGVRPLVTAELLREVLGAAKEHGAATAGLPVHDTVKRVDDQGNVVETVDRTRLVTVQTPQAFKKQLLLAAHQNATENNIQATDDAGLIEQLGATVHVVSGESRNIKLTRPDDLKQANFWIQQEETVGMRVGIGYDVHRLVPDRPLILGGVEIPHSLGLLGHSDADVLTHAVMDALLGAAALGDIGQHFPDTDPKYEGASSIELLKDVVALLRERGYAPAQIDAVVAAQKPRLAPFIVPMRESLAAAMDLPLDAVGVKATTAEGLGFVGREEGMEARVVVTLRDCPSD